MNEKITLAAVSFLVVMHNLVCCSCQYISRLAKSRPKRREVAVRGWEDPEYR